MLHEVVLCDLMETFWWKRESLDKVNRVLAPVYMIELLPSNIHLTPPQLTILYYRYRIIQARFLLFHLCFHGITYCTVICRTRLATYRTTYIQLILHDISINNLTAGFSKPCHFMYLNVNHSSNRPIGIWAFYKYNIRLPRIERHLLWITYFIKLLISYSTYKKAKFRKSIQNKKLYCNKENLFIFFVIINN